MLMGMAKGGLQAKTEKWLEETPPMKRFTILVLLILFLGAFGIWYWNWYSDWAKVDLGSMLVYAIFNTFIFFLIIIPLTRFWKKIYSN
jgi:uncharacterized membrane protein YagU involved in acid resistance